VLRREFVRAVVSVSFAPKLLLSQQATTPAPPPPAPVPWTLGLNPKTPLPHTEVADGITETKQSFFMAAQMATLIRLSDVLMPPIGDKPGALQAGTPLFLDFFVGSSPAPRRKLYTSGLNWLELESQTKYKKPFARLDDDQAGAILKPWLRTWMSDHPPTETHADFINIAHDDIRTATVNSKMWNEASSSGAKASASDGLYWYPVDPSLDALTSDRKITPSTIVATPKNAHSMPMYQR
jgi:Gluconate 2-dehydrogenase subunit 3